LKLSATTFRNIISKLEGKEKEFEYDISKISRMRPFVKEGNNKLCKLADETSVLSKTYLFQGLTEEQINMIAASLEQQRLYTKDTYVIHEG
jgi:hypothetical protein